MLPKYFNEYKVSNISAMIRNNGRNPKICTDNFTGRLVVISGATSGIGYITAKKFASQGADLLCINRNEKKSAKLKEEIERKWGVSCEYIIADLSNLSDIRGAAAQLIKVERSIDVLIHNAGAYLTKREMTQDGIEKIFVVNYLSSFIINTLLSEKLKSQGRARIILVSSEGHRFVPWGLELNDLNWQKRRYSGLKSYGSAKLAQLQSMLIFADRFSSSGVTINAMHPGAVRSETGQENGAFYRWIKKHVYDRMLRPTEISSESIYYLGVSKEMEGVSGKFFNLTTMEEPAPPALDKQAAFELWTKTLEMTGMQDIFT